VWKAKHKPSGKIVVLKMMHKQELIVSKSRSSQPACVTTCLLLQDEEVVHQIKREVEIHYRCRHPNIARMHCYFQTRDKRK
jgi:serine/threonine protein kinase